jgi:hypothetical protein
MTDVLARDRRGVKRSHLLPRSYLRGFLPLGSEVLWRYSKRGAGPVQLSINNASVERFFYAFPLPDGSLDTVSIEALLEGVESQASLVLRKIHSATIMTSAERTHLCLFVGYMAARVKASRADMQNLFGRWAELELEKLARNPERFEDEIDRWEQETGGAAPVLRERLRQWAIGRKHYLQLAPHSTMLPAFQFAESLARTLCMMTLTVLEAPDGCDFVTSDNPVCREIPGRSGSALANPGLDHESVEVTCPLTSRSALLASWLEGAPRRIGIRPAAAREVNRRTVMNADRYVYASKRSPGLDGLVKKHAKTRPETRFEIEYEHSGARLAAFKPPLRIQSLVQLLRGNPGTPKI